ncbi:MAG TPA: Spy/CpxP family protein refolding chaperone [Gemmatimonadales bacterium]|nr:Spy/CpxP family protein refolding chaperone [Gemmatimonadales bacterium]
MRSYLRSHLICSLALLLPPFASLAAQRADTAGDRRSDSLRHQIEERFAARVQQELRLTSEQATKLRATSATYGARRRELRDQERRIRHALWQQLQPGVAANNDSVSKLTDAMIELKLTSAQAARDEMKELSRYLNPVQRARLYVMREQLYHRVKKAHGHRGMGHREKDKSWM